MWYISSVRSAVVDNIIEYQKSWGTNWTRLKQTSCILKNYSGLFKEGHTNYRVYGGVAIFIHETIPYQKLTLNTSLQAIAARIKTGRDVTIVSICNSRSHAMNENLLSTLFQQLPEPVISAGHFNSYLQIWGNPESDNRGCQVLSYINKNQRKILNDGRHTRTSATSKSAIDLTIASPLNSPSYPGMSQTVLQVSTTVW